MSSFETHIGTESIKIKSIETKDEVVKFTYKDGYIEVLGRKLKNTEDLKTLEDDLDELYCLKRKNIFMKEIIDSCLEFIDDLLPRYMDEKHHIIMGDNWELNRSIYVMSEIRDRLSGFVRGDKDGSRRN